NNGYNGNELWITDGTTAGTSLVKDINPSAFSPASSNPQYITVLGNGEAVFQADDGPGGRELWVTDGTAGGTMLVKDINLGAGSSITAIGNGQALFQFDDGTDGREMWITDGTAAGTHLADDINPGAGNSSPSDFTVL